MLAPVHPPVPLLAYVHSIPISPLSQLPIESLFYSHFLFLLLSLMADAVGSQSPNVNFLLKY